MPVQPDLDILCRGIRQAHRERVFAMDQRKRSDSALGSYLRGGLGWRKSLPADQRKLIETQVATAIKVGEAVSKGNDDDPSDPIYLRYAALIDAALEARKPFAIVENEARLEMLRSVRKLPVWVEWAKGVLGVGDTTIGTIIGETGSLDNYPSVASVAKRMGLAVIDGRRQGNPGTNASKTEWIRHGYNARRRSYLWVAGDVFVRGKGPYRAHYDRIKSEELAKAAARGQTVEPASARTKNDPEHFMSVGHVHLRAKRRVEKLFLKHLLMAWKATAGAGAGRTKHSVSVQDQKSPVRPVPDFSHEQALA